VFGEHYQFLPKPEILSLEEIARLTEVFCKLGLEKIRLTGGEPLLRRGMPELIAMLAAIPGERDIAMTTNGTILPRYAKKLKVAGLHRVTISLDAIDPKVFAHMNGVGASPDRVLEGIDAALEYGLGVKVNSVIQKGVNEDQVLPLAEFARERGVTLRFIEFMDTGNTNGWKLDQVVPYTEMIQSLHQHFPLEPLEPAHVGETARRFSYKDFPDQEIGFITSVSKPFCADCNRIRLSADGHLYTCLFASHGHDIKSLLRAGASDAELIAMIHGVWSVRDDRYSEIRTEIGGTHVKPEMSYIGG
jgi:cyclic pyranopterin phosphate synthase